MKAFVGAAAASGMLVPVVVVATAAGAFVGGRTSAGAVIVVFYTAFSVGLNLVGRDGRWHGNELSEHTLWNSLLRFCVSRFVLCPLSEKSFFAGDGMVLAGSVVDGDLLIGCWKGGKRIQGRVP